MSASFKGVCGSIGYDRRGRILSTCVGVQRALNLIDPHTLDVIDAYELPGTLADNAGGGNDAGPESPIVRAPSAVEPGPVDAVLRHGDLAGRDEDLDVEGTSLGREAGVWKVLVGDGRGCCEQPRLVDLTWLTGAFTKAGHADWAAELSPADVPGLRTLRDSLRGVFEYDDPGQVASLLNPLLEAARAIPLLVVDADGGAALRVGVGRRGLAALEVRLPAALAAYVADHGPSRLGVCLSDPCRCVFVDRTRAGTRKYCCSYCNDRYAARAYRRRKRS